MLHRSYRAVDAHSVPMIAAVALALGLVATVALTGRVHGADECTLLVVSDPDLDGVGEGEPSESNHGRRGRLPGARCGSFSPDADVELSQFLDGEPLMVVEHWTADAEGKVEMWLGGEVAGPGPALAPAPLVASPAAEFGAFVSYDDRLAAEARGLGLSVVRASKGA